MGHLGNDTLLFRGDPNQHEEATSKNGVLGSVLQTFSFTTGFGSVSLVVSSRRELQYGGGRSCVEGGTKRWTRLTCEGKVLWGHFLRMPARKLLSLFSFLQSSLLTGCLLDCKNVHDRINETHLIRRWFDPVSFVFIVSTHHSYALLHLLLAAGGRSSLI